MFMYFLIFLTQLEVVLIFELSTDCLTDWIYEVFRAIEVKM